MSAFHPLRPHSSSRQMREKRTARALFVFGVVLACIELYIVYSAL
ncbi:hypothetical protein [Rhizobium vallis]|nr:hypothetical protein [Rhizobium vallis]